MNYWINTVSKDHLQRGIAGGFTQANHGKNTILKRLKTGDWIIFYSPRASYQQPKPPAEPVIPPASLHQAHFSTAMLPNRTDSTPRSASRGENASGTKVRSSWPNKDEGGEPLQAFTAIGQVTDDELYQVEMFPGFIPWRRKVTFYDCVETPIRPLIDNLSFIEDKTHWGYKFRFGLFQIPEPDFLLIKNTIMNVVERT